MDVFASRERPPEFAFQDETVLEYVPLARVLLHVSISPHAGFSSCAFTTDDSELLGA